MEKKKKRQMREAKEKELQDYKVKVNDGGGRREGAVTYSSPLARKAEC